ncbi:sigma-54 dependent transcriptional regulator [Ignavibacteria bacterium]|nr:sigma-54-dependent Fis family transcriptional regulator [Bacteroidota bacterium]MCZ2131645.1 sigma-54 dependent transcriptional regulator [Bacteroidota bacterium]
MPAKTADIENGILNNLETRFGIVGRSPAMTLAVRRLLQVAPTDLTVLVTGETGTGKEVFAQAIHGLSKRRKSPFVSVNCGAIPETLLESELFGHEKGAFTGAADQRKGFFESAHNGTILLDEIGEMPVATQVKLLRILENGEFSRLGSSEIRRVNVRVIAATNRDLEYEVKRGNFRQDLYFRLNSVQILLPPLRKRKQDIPYLAEYFAARAAEKNGIVFGGFTEDAIEILETLPWPGNIRELRNFIETVVTLERGQRITPEILRAHIRPALTSGTNSDLPVKFEPEQDYYAAPSTGSSINAEIIYRSLLEIRADIADLKRGLSMIMGVLAERREVVTVEPDEESLDTTDATERFADTLDEEAAHANIRINDMEKRLISEALRRSGGNRRIAAEQLGISDRTLYRKISEYKLE